MGALVEGVVAAAARGDRATLFDVVVVVSGNEGVVVAGVDVLAAADGAACCVKVGAPIFCSFLQV